jgi:ribosome-binding ATPase YchF (GTP1/OBG family)
LGNLITKLEKETKSKDKKDLKKLAIVKKIKNAVSEGKLISEISLTDEEKTESKEFQFLTQKPILYILNTNGKTSYSDFPFKHLIMNLKDEEEVSELSEAEAKELNLKSLLDQLITSCYTILDLITFFTVAGGKETRAWTLKRGSSAHQAAGCVHSDFEEKFIRAEVIPWQKLIETGSWKEAREKGLIKTAGKEYVVNDGDIIEFKI